MKDIDKTFDGVLWEWRGMRVTKDLKPICPQCQFELDIKGPSCKLHWQDRPTRGMPSLSFSRSISYLCPNCSFSQITSIDNVDSPEHLRKVALKEFEHRQRLKDPEKPKE